MPLDSLRTWFDQHPEQGYGPPVTQKAFWYVNGDGFNPFWAWYTVSLISLADVPGLPPAVRQYPQAEFELMIVSLDRRMGEPEVNGLGAWKPAEAHLAYQFHGITEEQAFEATVSVVEAMCAGVMQPDDTRKWQDTLNRIINDYRSGKFGGLPQAELDVDPFTHRLTGGEA